METESHSKHGLKFYHAMLGAHSAYLATKSKESPVKVCFNEAWLKDELGYRFEEVGWLFLDLVIGRERIANYVRETDDLKLIVGRAVNESLHFLTRISHVFNPETRDFFQASMEKVAIRLYQSELELKGILKDFTADLEKAKIPSVERVLLAKLIEASTRSSMRHFNYVVQGLPFYLLAINPGHPQAHHMIASCLKLFTHEFAVWQDRQREFDRALAEAVRLYRKKGRQGHLQDWYARSPVYLNPLENTSQMLVPEFENFKTGLFPDWMALAVFYCGQVAIVSALWFITPRLFPDGWTLETTIIILTGGLFVVALIWSIVVGPLVMRYEKPW